MNRLVTEPTSWCDFLRAHKNLNVLVPIVDKFFEAFLNDVLDRDSTRYQLLVALELTYRNS